MYFRFFLIPLAKLLAVLYVLWLGEKESLYKTLYSCKKRCTGVVQLYMIQ